MVWSIIWNFLNVSFYVKNTAKKCLVTFWLKNKPVQTIETWISKKGNLDIFSKGIVYDLVKKKFFFLFRFYPKKNREKVFVDVLDRKEAFKDKKNRSLWKTQT